MEYIEAAKDDPDGCIFCDLPAKGDDAAMLILSRGEGAFVLMNSFPYNPGHLMVAPFRHTGDFEDLHADELADIDALLKRSLRALREEMEPQGFNIGMNLGRVAGAGIPDHVHWHVVPRSNGRRWSGSPREPRSPSTSRWPIPRWWPARSRHPRSCRATNGTTPAWTCCGRRWPRRWKPEGPNGRSRWPSPCGRPSRPTPSSMSASARSPWRTRPGSWVRTWRSRRRPRRIGSTRSRLRPW